MLPLVEGPVVGFGICDLDLIYPVACRLALSEVNAPAIVIDESCRIVPRATDEQEVDVAWDQHLEAKEAVTPPRGKRTVLKWTNVSREARTRRTWNSSHVAPHAVSKFGAY
jgi:hypothetical protein